MVIGDLNDAALHCGRLAKYSERGLHAIAEHGGSVDSLGPLVYKLVQLSIGPCLGEG